MTDFDFFSSMGKSDNVPVYSVTDLSMTLKQMVEDNFSYVRVRGELSKVTLAKSGHVYTSLKDDTSVIDAICWKGTVPRLSVSPEEGLEVIVTGRLTTYPGRSNYQIIIESMEIAGQGALLKMLEDRKKKFAAEGLFDPEHKKPIPFLPQTIGVITSPTGAVIRDILHRLSDRFPVHVLVWPVMVQGKGASEQVTAAIRGFNTIDGKGKIPRPDVLIVARGGGSFEDLMPFNEENVVRAVFESDIPVISAIGHETDTTLIDYVSDLRAPTPTGAAEKAVPVRADLLSTTQMHGVRLLNALNKRISDADHKTTGFARGLTHPKKFIEMLEQRLDHTEAKLSSSFERIFKDRENKVERTVSRLTHPSHLIRLAEERLNGTGKLLESLSFKSVLERGYAVVQSLDGKVIASQKEVPQKFKIKMKDGDIAAQKD